MPKIEVVKQRDLKDCGACCIESILKLLWWLCSIRESKG